MQEACVKKNIKILSILFIPSKKISDTVNTTGPQFDQSSSRLACLLLVLRAVRRAVRRQERRMLPASIKSLSLAESTFVDIDVDSVLSWIYPANEEAESLYSCTASNVLFAAEAVVTPANAAAPLTIRLKNCLLFNSFIFASLLRVLGFGFPSSPSGLRRASRVLGSGFKVQGSGFRGSGFWFSPLGFRLRLRLRLDRSLSATTQQVGLRPHEQGSGF